MSEKNIYTFPPIIQETLANGLHLMLVEDHEQEGITLAFQMPAGEFCDPVSFEGATELVIGLLLKGPSSLTPEEFSDQLEHAGAGLFTDVGDEHTIIGCKMLARPFDLIMPLFWNMLGNPGLSPKELARLKREMITGLQAELADPMSIANRHFGSVLCGAAHPVGRVQTIQSVKKITMRQIREYYDSLVSPENGSLVIAGDFDSREVMQKFRPFIESWKKKRKIPVEAAGTLPPLSSNRIRLIDKKDLSQVSFIIGYPVCGELDPMRNELALANYILGGGNFSSRLMAHIRSQEGKTYGISSQFSCNRGFGIFSIATSTQTAKAAEMLTSIMDVCRTFAENGVTGEELDKAKKFALGSMAFQLEGIVNVAEKLLWLREFGRDVSYIERFNERIEGITLQGVNDAIRKYLSSSHYAITAVGKKEEIQNILAAYGAVETVDFRKNP
ncbi:MAG TPA: pitrilysin family protein [Chitinivibrionales bacterium]|nr:pitrilysin family protein [Chitinivibrionales bacterium]